MSNRIINGTRQTDADIKTEAVTSTQTATEKAVPGLRQPAVRPMLKSSGYRHVRRSHNIDDGSDPYKDRRACMSEDPQSYTGIRVEKPTSKE